jgi:hypothetical protein
MFTDHWVHKFIGFKWTINYNCFDHFCHVQKLQFGIEGLDSLTGMPEFEERSEALAFIKTCKDLARWKEIHPNMAKEGDAVLFGVEGATFHIGTYVDSGTAGKDKHKGVLHCDKKMGVVLTNMLSIRNAKSNITFMRYTKHA